MVLELQPKGKQNVDIHYVNGPLPCVVEENFEGCYYDHDDFVIGEVLQDQESVYQSFQRNGKTAQFDMARSSSSTSSGPFHSQNRQEGNSSEAPSVKSQLAIDEALAREMQELENHLAGTAIGESTGTEADITRTQSPSTNGGSSTASTSTQVPRQDDIDPDGMTYEELQSLGEAIGTQSRGLSDELISYLESSTYKTGLFSRKDKNEECVICYMAYKNRDKLIKLPCQHQYHKSCVTRWLKINKACPICNEEVFG